MLRTFEKLFSLLVWYLPRYSYFIQFIREFGLKILSKKCFL